MATAKSTKPEKCSAYPGNIPNGGSFQAEGGYVNNPGVYAGTELRVSSKAPRGGKAIPKEKLNK